MQKNMQTAESDYLDTSRDLKQLEGHLWKPPLDVVVWITSRDEERDKRVSQLRFFRAHRNLADPEVLALYGKPTREKLMKALEPYARTHRFNKITFVAHGAPGAGQLEIDHGPPPRTAPLLSLLPSQQGPLGLQAATVQCFAHRDPIHRPEESGFLYNVRLDVQPSTVEQGAFTVTYDVPPSLIGYGDDWGHTGLNPWLWDLPNVKLACQQAWDEYVAAHPQ